MNLRIISALVLIVFCSPSIILAANETNETPSLQPAPKPVFSAVGGSPSTLTLGSLDANTGFNFLIDFTSRGAGISDAKFSKFDNLDKKNPQPLVILSPTVNLDGTPAFSMATRLIILDNQFQFRLDKLDWTASDVEKNDGIQIARFEAIIKDKATGQPAIKLTKTYRVTTNIYDIDCDLAVENLSSDEHKIQFELTGPAGIKRDDPRTDSRKTIAAFRDTKGEIVTTLLDINKLKKVTTPEDRQLKQHNAGFIWAAIACKYFTAIVVPTPDANMNFCSWITDKSGWFANPDADNEKDSGDETVGINIKTTIITLAPAGSKKLSFKLFLGPKDKSLFDKVPMYKNLGFVNTMDFMACCCPAAMIHPLAFGILWLLKWMHGFWPYNYGIVIIILVLLVRLILHPLTRLSQVSMSKYAKFNSLPEVQEIKKQYGKDLMEQNRRLAEVQKKYGVSHSAAVMGMLPTMVQMPIWIALYGAVYASIDLRGAEFLPFWITDLSAPDALIKFATITLPFGIKIDSFNLLPILMGVAFYLQQKLMPAQAAADPQTAQQQKIMMLMMPLMFPLMLYNSPSGLNLYIMASVFGGVIEQYLIKKHIDKQGQLEAENLVPVTSKTGGKVKKQKPKPFFKI
jgi:YidC/Oxa1 family membrane protein insertase